MASAPSDGQFRPPIIFSPKDKTPFYKAGHLMHHPNITGTQYLHLHILTHYYCYKHYCNYY